MMRHTSGPWGYDSGGDCGSGVPEYAVIAANDGDVLIAEFNQCIPEGYANARLMAAAPDMLDALKRVLANTEEPCDYDGVWDSVRAAISKAEEEGACDR